MTTTARHKFQEEWLADPNFQPWLVKVSNDISRAYCRYCAVVLRAHKTDISHHGTTLKHQSNGKIAVESGTSTNTPISVQIVFNEGDVDLGSGGDHGKDVQSTPTTTGPHVDLNNSIVNSQQQLQQQSGTPNNSQSQFIQQLHGNTLKRPLDEATSSTPRRYACKRYRVEWESDPLLKDWVKSYKHDASKAYCRVCETPLRAHKHDLVLHAKSTKHTKQASFFDFSAENDGNNTNSSDSFEDARGIVGEGGETSDEVHQGNSAVGVGPGTSSNNSHHHQLHQLKLESVDSILLSGRSNIITADAGNMIVSLPANHMAQGTPLINGDEMSDRGEGNLSSGDFDTSKSSVEQKMIRVTRKLNTGVYRRRQTYINAADVVAAIENNEFTGYELLQIVKAAVPKL